MDETRSPPVVRGAEEPMVRETEEGSGTRGPWRGTNSLRGGADAAGRRRGSPCFRTARPFPSPSICCALAGTDTTRRPYRRRRAALDDLFGAHRLVAPWALCLSTTEAATVREWLAWTAVGIEGIVLERLDSRYEPAVRGRRKYAAGPGRGGRRRCRPGHRRPMAPPGPLAPDSSGVASDARAEVGIRVALDAQQRVLSLLEPAVRPVVPSVVGVRFPLRRAPLASAGVPGLGERDQVVDVQATGAVRCTGRRRRCRSGPRQRAPARPLRRHPRLLRQHLVTSRTPVPVGVDPVPEGVPPVAGPVPLGDRQRGQRPTHGEGGGPAGVTSGCGGGVAGRDEQSESGCRRRGGGTGEVRAGSCRGTRRS